MADTKHLRRSALLLAGMLAATGTDPLAASNMGLKRAFAVPSGPSPPARAWLLQERDRNHLSRSRRSTISGRIERSSTRELEEPRRGWCLDGHSQATRPGMGTVSASYRSGDSRPCVEHGIQEELLVWGEVDLGFIGFLCRSIMLQETPRRCATISAARAAWASSCGGTRRARRSRGIPAGARRPSCWSRESVMAS
jgi:hypothetical protein